MTMPTGWPSLGDDQRLPVAGQQLDRLAHRVGRRDGRERRLHHVDDVARHQLRVDIARLSSPRSPTDPDDGAVVVPRDDRQLGDAVLVQEARSRRCTFWCVCTVTNGGISPAARLVAQDVADGAVAAALEEAVLGHPRVVEDLAQVGAAAVGQDDGDHRLGVVDLVPPPAARRGRRGRSCRPPAGPRRRPAGGW